MCGLVAVVALNKWGIGVRERQVFQDMLMADAVRGKDGTGVFIVDEEQNARMLKRENDPFTLFRDRQWGPFFEPPYHAKRPDDLVLVGHNRAASVGKISTANAHPHKSGHIVLVHNGTLHSYAKLPNINKHDVDSMALADGIAELGVDEAISRANGSYAIIYYDQSDNTINFLRNDDRPLFFAPDASQNRLFFASEQGMLRWVLNRQGVKTEPVLSLKPHVLMSVVVDHDVQSPKFRTVEGPKVHSYFRKNNLTDFVEADVDPIVEPYLLSGPKNHVPSNKEKRRETHILKTLKKDTGIQAVMVDSFDTKTVGEPILFKVVNYTESLNADWPFTMEGTNPLHPLVEFRFRLKTAEAMETVLEHPMQIGVIRRIMHLPQMADGGAEYIVWVSDCEPMPTPDEPVIEVDMATVTKLGPQEIAEQKDDVAEVVLDCCEVPQSKKPQPHQYKADVITLPVAFRDPYQDPEVKERLLH